jgi:4-hydroxy-tetrahydrodipicolinate reductase
LSPTPKVAVFGVTGRMGQCLVRALREPRPALELGGALASGASARLGQDAALDGAPTGVRITADVAAALADAAVAVDFSLAGSIGAHADACLERRIALLVGATGFDAAARGTLERAARSIPVLIAPNTSLGVTVMTRLLEVAARALGGYEAEISGVHHRMKRDAPSGTALAWGEAIARARGAKLGEVAVFDRHASSSPRAPGSIGFASLRAGDVIGEHTAVLATDGERLELTHRAQDRMVFARGALTAAAWLLGRPAGLYGMQDVLGF